jgi:hypothetical protein
MTKERERAAVPGVDALANPTKAELQRQMEEARDSITETVSEIKSVVSQQYEEVRDTYETVKEGVGEVLDWREQFERNPVVWGAGAVSVGILIGVGLSHVFDDEEEKGRGRRKSKEPGTGERLIGELTGLADAVLPTISGKIKELFGLDISEYLSAANARRATRERVPQKRTAKKRPSQVARGAKKSAAKRVSAKKPAAKKSDAKKPGAS